MIAMKNTIVFTLHNSLIYADGRYLALDCTLDNTRYTIVNVFAPNTRQIRLLSKLMKKLIKFCKGYLIVCGDFNIVPDNSIDTIPDSLHLWGLS